MLYIIQHITASTLTTLHDETHYETLQQINNNHITSLTLQNTTQRHVTLNKITKNLPTLHKLYIDTPH